MTKLGLHILEKMMSFDKKGKSLFTKTEVLFLIWLSRLQDDDGSVFGVHYKNASRDLGICFQSFYDVIKSLEKKGVIETDWYGKHGYWNFRILDNDYSSGNYSEKPYLNTNHLILHRPEFYNLSLNQIVIVLNIIKIMNFGSRNSKNNNISLRLETLMRWTGKSRRSVLKMIKGMSSIKHFLSFDVEGDNVFIPLGFNKFRLNELHPAKESDIKTFHAIKHTLHRMRNKSLLNNEDLKKMVDDICILMRQYKIKTFEAISGFVHDTLIGCGHLSPRYLHSLIRENVKKKKERAEAKVRFEKFKMSLATSN